MKGISQKADINMPKRADRKIIALSRNDFLRRNMPGSTAKKKALSQADATISAVQ